MIHKGVRVVVGCLSVLALMGFSLSPQAEYQKGQVEDNGDLHQQAKAEYWYRKAAHQGYAPAEYDFSLCLLSSKTKSESAYWLRKAAHQGYTRAENTLAVSYMTGALGVPKNYKKMAYCILADRRPIRGVRPQVLHSAEAFLSRNLHFINRTTLPVPPQ